MVTQEQGADAILYSIVIPVYNEAEVLPTLYGRLTRMLEGLNEPYEIIVNDGSQDDSILLLRDFQARDERVRVAAPFFGISGIRSPLPRGSIIAPDRSIVIDADLQDPPRNYIRS